MAVSREQTQAKLDLLASGVTRHVPEQTYLVPDRFEELASQYPDQTFLFYNGQEISFSQLNRRANQYAQAATTLGIKNGDVGSVMMENRPEFFYAWLGLAKIGAIASLINTQARGEALRHAIEETASKILFLGNECTSLFVTVPGLGATVKTLCVADGDNQATELCADIDSLEHYLTTAPEGNPPPSGRDGITGESPLFYAFTSGTTGLPKAAIISHMRWLGVGDGWSAVLGMTPDDVLYCFLPLFHGAAGMSLVSNALSSRAPIVLRRRFSASQFWIDVRQYNITTVLGFLQECEPGEVGEILGLVLNIPGVGAGRFEGYVSPEATEKKILRDVFTSGDAWFSSGDLLVRNAMDYLYFVDRIGDTYRWKSENVSTTEVAEALEAYDPAETINVFGVVVAGQEGREGMLAIRLKEGREFDPAGIYEQAVSKLPDYAVPLFVRILAHTDITLTYKLRKVDLQKTGYNPANCVMSYVGGTHRTRFLYC